MYTAQSPFDTLKAIYLFSQFTHIIGCENCYTNAADKAEALKYIIDNIPSDYYHKCLDLCIQQENYEIAAYIRDAIAKHDLQPIETNTGNRESEQYNKMEENVSTTKKSILAAYKAADENGRNLLKELYPEVFKSPVDWRELDTVKKCVIANGGDPELFLKKIEGLDPDTQAFEMLKQCRDAVHGEDGPIDRANHSIAKWRPYFVDNGSGLSFDDNGHGYAGTYVGARLDVLSSEKARHLGTKFLPLYIQFITNIKQ